MTLDTCQDCGFGYFRCSVVWSGVCRSPSNKLNLFMKAHLMVGKGCLAYYIQDISLESPIIDTIRYVRKFFDVFHTN